MALEDASRTGRRGRGRQKPEQVYIPPSEPERVYVPTSEAEGELIAERQAFREHDEKRTTYLTNRLKRRHRKDPERMKVEIDDLERTKLIQVQDEARQYLQLAQAENISFARLNKKKLAEGKKQLPFTEDSLAKLRAAIIDIDTLPQNEDTYRSFFTATHAALGLFARTNHTTGDNIQRLNRSVRRKEPPFMGILDARHQMDEFNHMSRVDRPLGILDPDYQRVVEGALKWPEKKLLEKEEKTLFQRVVDVQSEVTNQIAAALAENKRATKRRKEPPFTQKSIADLQDAIVDVNSLPNDDDTYHSVSRATHAALGTFSKANGRAVVRKAIKRLEHGLEKERRDKKNANIPLMERLWREARAMTFVLLPFTPMVMPHVEFTHAKNQIERAMTGMDKDFMKEAPDSYTPVQLESILPTSALPNNSYLQLTTPDQSNMPEEARRWIKKLERQENLGFVLFRPADHLRSLWIQKQMGEISRGAAANEGAALFPEKYERAVERGYVHSVDFDSYFHGSSVPRAEAIITGIDWDELRNDTRALNQEGGRGVFPELKADDLALAQRAVESIDPIIIQAIMLAEVMPGAGNEAVKTYSFLMKEAGTDLIVALPALGDNLASKGGSQATDYVLGTYSATGIISRNLQPEVWKKLNLRNEYATPLGKNETGKTSLAKSPYDIVSQEEDEAVLLANAIYNIMQTISVSPKAKDALRAMTDDIEQSRTRGPQDPQYQRAIERMAIFLGLAHHKPEAAIDTLETLSKHIEGSVTGKLDEFTTRIRACTPGGRFENYAERVELNLEALFKQLYPAKKNR